MTFCSPRRVLHVIGCMDRGGAETIVMNVYRAINRDLVQFDFLVHESREADYNKEIRALGGRIYSINERFNGLNYFSYQKKCKDFFLNHHDYAAVHVHIGSSAALVIKEAKRYGLFTIAHSHNTNPPISVMELGFRFFSYPTRKLADYFLACSRQAGIDRFGRKTVEGNKFSVLMNGIKTSDYAFDAQSRIAKRAELGIDGSTFVIGHVGRFAPEKNHEFLVKAFSHIKEQVDNSLLVLVGRGDLRPNIESLVKAFGLEDDVLFLGVRDDIPDVLSAFDSFIFPSIWEGLGMSAIEAQASGLPVLLSASLPEIAACTPNALRVDLELGPKKWAELALGQAKASSGDRKKGAEAVSSAGFDIGDTALFLTDLYLGNKKGDGVFRG